ncbi:hypothetical protein HID58_085846, partial [Brassica napus]
VSALKPFKTMGKLRKQYSAQAGESIEMVLVYSSGEKIHATLPTHVDLIEPPNTPIRFSFYP